MEHYFSKFFDYVSQILIMPDHDKDLCKQLFEPKAFKKGSILAEPNAVPLFHNFIVSGHVRNFYIDQNGNEITTDLNEGSRLFTSYFHFMNRSVSQECIQCLTDCEVLRISRDNVDIAARDGITQKDYTVQILNQRLEISKQRAFEMANHTAEYRYHQFAKENLNIMKNVPLGFIASYLGITPRHLSRIRKEA
jgi:CRP/FNR family transcriptional regulator, anaerobic regulatory protein